MLADYLPIGVLIVVAVVLVFLVIVIGHSFGPRRPTQRKLEA